MAESIPDVVLRLARRHLPADAAVPANLPADHELEFPGQPCDSLTPLPREKQDEATKTLRENNCRLSLRERAHFRGAKGDDTTTCSRAEPNDHVPAASADPLTILHSTDHQSAGITQTPRATFDDLPTPEPLDILAGRQPQPHELSYQTPQIAVQPSGLHAAGETPAPQSIATADESNGAPSDTESFAERELTFQQARAFVQSSPSEASPPRAVDFPIADSFQPANRFSSGTSSAPDQPAVDAVSEASRQLEQTARDLETSLTHLFTTQIETLKHLRDRVDEQERRWVEQQGARRAML